jgi:hypothetical protein
MEVIKEYQIKIDEKQLIQFAFCFNLYYNKAHVGI